MPYIKDGTITGLFPYCGASFGADGNLVLAGAAEQARLNALIARVSPYGTRVLPAIGYAYADAAAGLTKLLGNSTAQAQLAAALAVEAKAHNYSGYNFDVEPCTGAYAKQCGNETPGIVTITITVTVTIICLVQSRVGKLTEKLFNL